MARYNKIFRGPVEKDRPYTQEAIANVALPPGSIVTRNAAGAFILHATAAERGAFYVVSEDYLGQNDPDTDVLSGDTAVAYYPYPSYRFAALVATGNNVPLDGPLTSNGAGILRIAVATEEALFYAEEAFNNTSGSNQLIRVRPAQGEVA